MRSITGLLIVALLAACGSAGDEAPPAGPTLADFAGTWQITATLEGTPDPVPSTLRGSADSNEWSMDLEGRPDIPVQVSVVGDSLIGQTGQYESILRAGVMVTVRIASALQDGMLMGTLLATYQTPEGMEEVAGTTHGMRAP